MKRVLILTPQLPYPPEQGASLRNYHIILGLASARSLTLISAAEPGAAGEAPSPGPLAELCESVHLAPLPARRRRQRLVQLLASNRPDMARRLASAPLSVRLRDSLASHFYEIVQIEGLELAHLMPLVRQLSPRSRLVYDAHNAEAALQRRAFLTDITTPRRWPLALYSWIQVRRLARYERWALEMADAVTAVSEADRLALRALAPDADVSVIPNCLDVAAYEAAGLAAPAADGPRYDLVFSGKMDYRPNVDAVLWFAEAIWPRLLEARPGTTLAVVGQRPHPRLETLRRLPGITITGRVERVEPYLAGAEVFIMPFRMGSGTRLKLIEAMAAGKAIVSTRMGAEGFPVAHNEQLMLADTPNEFATAILTLLMQPARRARLGDAARAFARAYDWRRVVPAFLALYDRLEARAEAG